jgi:hypothetical protein
MATAHSDLGSFEYPKGFIASDGLGGYGVEEKLVKTVTRTLFVLEKLSSESEVEILQVR